jgi:hypothetical protein
VCIRHSKEAVAQARVAYNTCLYVADFGPMQSHREFEAGEPMCDLTGSMHLSESLWWRLMFDETRNGRRPCARSFKPHLSAAACCDTPAPSTPRGPRSQRGKAIKVPIYSI